MNELTFELCFILGVLPERREVPVGQLQRAVGLHAGRDRHHPRRGVQTQEGARHLSSGASTPLFVPGSVS